MTCGLVGVSSYIIRVSHPICFCDCCLNCILYFPNHDQVINIWSPDLSSLSVSYILRTSGLQIQNTAANLKIPAYYSAIPVDNALTYFSSGPYYCWNHLLLCRRCRPAMH